jgi:copper chaperone CopZ
MSHRRVALPIRGRSCCATSGRVVERALAEVAGVCQSEANVATRRVLIEYDPTRCDIGDLQAAIARAGYGPPSSPAGRGGDPAAVLLLLVVAALIVLALVLSGTVPLR